MSDDEAKAKLQELLAICAKLDGDEGPSDAEEAVKIALAKFDECKNFKSIKACEVKKD
jgi:hypothetical protein